MVIIANLNSVAGISKEFVLTKQILIDIFQGNLTQWNDTRLTDLNPGRDDKQKRKACSMTI